jgi:galactose oxidase
VLNVTVTGADQVDLIAPPNTNVAPPGYYLLFVINNDKVPSEGKFIKLTRSGSVSIGTGHVTNGG